MKLQKNVNIRNRRASFEYSFLEEFTAGMVLMGTEIKAIREGRISLNEAYCYFHKGELFVKNMNIARYEKGTHYNHDPMRERKLLLSKRELRRLEEKLRDKSLTIIPTRLFISNKGWAKLNIALAKGKKLYDKRQDIKERDAKREMDRAGR